MNSRAARDWLAAGAIATVFSGIPSTLYNLLTSGDVAEPTRAAGHMLIASDSSDPSLFAAAALVHTSVSFFWAAILVALMPRKHVITASILAAALIAIIDLRLIAPAFFPEVARLEFLPQLADHLMWGACIGATLRYRWRAGAL